MSDVFISYAREDRVFVGLLAGRLEGHGWTVWWDRNLVTGARFGRVIEQELDAARCVIVVWSRHAVDSDWVRAEAHEGYRRGMLVPVCIDGTMPPLIFRQMHTAELSNWQDAMDGPAFQILLNDVATKLGTKLHRQPRGEDAYMKGSSGSGARRRKVFSKLRLGVLLGASMLAGLAIFLALGPSNGRHTQQVLARKLDAAAQSDLRTVTTLGPEERGLYWWKLLSATDRPVQLERAVLLALEAYRGLSYPGAEKTLRAGLALLTRPLAVVPYEAYGASALAFDPSGLQLAVVGPRNMARLREVPSGSEIARFVHSGAVNSVAFSSNARQFATASSDRSARLWDTASGAEILKLPHEYPVFHVTLNADGVYLATVSAAAVAGSTDAEVKIWRLPKSKPVTRLSHPMRDFRALVLSPSGRFVATVGSGNEAYLWAPDTGDRIARLTHGKPVTSLVISPDETRIATGSQDGSVYLWNTVGGAAAGQFDHGSGVEAVDFSPDGKSLVSGARNGTTKMWNLREPNAVTTLHHADRIIAVQWSPDGQHVATGSQDGTARVWEALSGTEIARYTHRDNVTAIRFSPDGSLLATGSHDGEAKIWRVRPDDLAADACLRLTRNLSRAEWQKHLGQQPYRKTCPQLP